VNKLLISALVSAGILAVSPAISAHAATSATEPTARSDARPGRDAKQGFRLPSERVEARLTRAREALKLTTAQLPLWESFANVTRTSAKEADQRIQQRRAEGKSAAPRKARTAIERMERRQQMLTASAARLDRQLAAAKPLYAALTAEQKQVADKLLVAGERHGHRQGKRSRG